MNYGVALEKQGDTSGALAHYEKSVRLGPLRVEAYNNLGNLLDNMGRPQEAIAQYREAIRWTRRARRCTTASARCSWRSADYAGGMAEFTTAARLDPDYPWPYFQMAKTLLKQGRDAEAIDQFRAAMRIAPDNYQILAYTAHILAAERKSRSARRQVRAGARAQGK